LLYREFPQFLGAGQICEIGYTSNNKSPISAKREKNNQHYRKSQFMKTWKQFNGSAVGITPSTLKYVCILSVLALAIPSAKCADTINQAGTSGTTYTGNDNAVASSLPANPGRDISSATIANDANNLYITLNLDPSANIASGGSYNYIIGITTGNPSAGGDTSANATTHGNAYGRAISFDSGFGGMTDFIGFYGAGGSGTTGSPFTSFGFNDYVFGTPGSTNTAGAWKKIETVASGEPISAQPGYSTPSSITLTVPMSDFAANLALTPGTTFDFDIYSTGTSGNQTAYDSLANPGPTQTGTYNGTAQYNATILDQYTIAQVPEPSVTSLVVIGLGCILGWRRRQPATV
jgi:hypothetical protein